MAIGCPNKNMPDWNDLVGMLGEDGAYYVFIKNGHKVPYLQDRGSNRFIWDVENDLGLVTWTRDNGSNVKKYKGFDRNTAADIVSKIRDQYVGDYNIARVAPDTKGEFGIKITGYPLPRAEVEKYAQEYNKDFVDAEKDYRLYEEFKIREKEANEDILPLTVYDQREGLFVDGYRKRTQEEKFNKDQVNALTSILRATMPQVTDVIEDYNLPDNVVGRLEPGGVIRYNPDKLLKSTLGHEFGHLLIDLRGGLSDSFIKQGIEQLMDTPLAKRVIAKYPDLQGTEQLQKEILAEAIGMEVADIFEQGQDKTGFERWLLRMFRWLGARLGITKNHARELASELLSGKPINPKKFTGTVVSFTNFEIMGEDFNYEAGEGISLKVRYTGKLDKNIPLKNRATKVENEYKSLRQMWDKTIQSTKDLEGTIDDSGNIDIGNGRTIYIKRMGLKSLAEYKEFELNRIATEKSDKKLKDQAEDIVPLYEEANEFMEVSLDEEGCISGSLGGVGIELPTQLRGKGLGKELYRTVGEYLKEKGQTLKSDALGHSKSSHLVWESLRKSGEARIIKGEKEDFSQGFYTAQYEYIGGKYTAYQEQREEGDVTDQEVTENLEGMKTQAIINQQLTKYEKLRQQAEDIISTRIRKARSRGSLENVTKLESLFKTLESSEVEDKRAIVQFVDNAVRQINATYKIYQEKAKQEAAGIEDAFNIQTLIRWNDILSAYDILDDISTTILKDGFREGSATFDSSTTAKFKRILDDAISKKNLLRDEFKDKGADILTENLSKYSTKYIATIREEKRKEWIKNNPDTTLKGDKRTEALNKYAEDYIAANINELQEQAKNVFRQETEKASEDIGLLTRWLDTVLDSNDMMISAMVKKMVISKGIAREKGIEMRNKMWPLVEQMYKNAGYKYLSVPPSKVYDFMLEKGRDGKRTGYIVSKFRSDLMQEYRKVLQETEMLPDKERQEKRRKWKDENMPSDKAARDSALASYIDSLVADGIMTKEEVEVYETNLKRPYRDRFDLETIINIEAANSISKWYIENSFEFRNPSDKWVNPQWAELQKILADKNDPRAKFYNLIKSELKKVDQQLPFAKRKYDELPFRIKTNDERFAEGQSAKTIGKETWEDLTTRRADDIERGQYTDETGQPIDFIPWYYQRPGEGFDHIFEYKIPLKKKKGGKQKYRTKRISINAKTGEEAQKKFNNLVPDATESKVVKVKEAGWNDMDQSYDLMGLYSSYFSMAYDYVEMADILPEAEMTKRLAENRKYVVTDPKGNPIKKVMENLRSRELTKEGATSLLVQQFGDFMKMQAYGQGKAEEGSWDVMGWKFDKAKMRDLLGKYSSYNMLGLNLIQGIANVSVGELTQIIESVAGEFFTTKDLHKATVEYSRGLGAVMGDIGAAIPQSKIGHLNEKWNILNEYTGGTYKKNSRFARMMNSSAMFFMSHVGEHFLQTRVMIAMLTKVEAKDSQGNVIGNMWEMYKTKNGQLVLDERVDLEKSNWDAEQQQLFGAKVKKLLSRLHGEYSDIGKSAAQRWSIGRMGLMFRKFVVPGFKRRWEKKKYNEFLGVYTEGSYRTVGRFIKQAALELRSLQFATLSENWKTLLPRERQNIIRGVLEFATATGVAILAGAFLSLRGEADDEDERRAYATMAYLALRTKSELFFFINPMETFTILKNPAVASSTIENMIKLVGQLFHPFDVYERGSWKGYPKILKSAINLTPMVKQYYKVKNVEDALTFFVR